MTASRPSFQTVALAAGKHRCPAEGVCALELASMLAGEPFTDRPKAVDRVIGAFLRAYNDAVDDDRRQALYACAADAVGTRDGARVERRRIARCVAEMDELFATDDRGPVRRLLLYPLTPRRLRRIVAADPAPDFALDQLGFVLADLLRRRGRAGHTIALDLFGDLVAAAPRHHPERMMQQPAGPPRMTPAPIPAPDRKEHP